MSSVDGSPEMATSEVIAVPPYPRPDGNPSGDPSCETTTRAAPGSSQFGRISSADLTTEGFGSPWATEWFTWAEPQARPVHVWTIWGAVEPVSMHAYRDHSDALEVAGLREYKARGRFFRPPLAPGWRAKHVADGWVEPELHQGGEA
jgi:hypothetical protein